MDNLPTPMLGGVTAITITSADLEQSLKFYQRLGFSELYRMDFPFPWIQITDGALLIMLRKDDNPYLALSYYVKDIEGIVTELKANGISFVQEPLGSDIVKRYLFKSPDGLNISLIYIPDGGFHQPTGMNLLTMPQQDYFNPEKYSNKVCGLFGELAHPVKNLNESIAFWEKIGFRVLSRFQSPYSWAIMSDGLAIVGLHETSQFSYPAITFFASDMTEKIRKLKEQGLENFVEKGPANIVVKTPEQQYINLFKLGM